jgi:hypothetical protein
MSPEDKRYVWKVVLSICIGLSIIFSVVVMRTDRHYTNRAIIEERVTMKIYIDSVMTVKIDEKLAPKLDTIMNQQDTIIRLLKK